MRSVVFVVPGKLETQTGGSIYDLRMTEGLRQYGWTVEIVELDESFPYPTPAALNHASQSLTTLPADSTVIIDGLVLSTIPDIIERETSRIRIVALIHLPIGSDVTIDRNKANQLKKLERRALDAATLIITTSDVTLALLADYEISRDRIVIIEPGTDPGPLSQGSKGTLLQLLSVATLHPGKGHSILLQALAEVAYQDWHLTCAGNITRYPATVEKVRAIIQRLNLEGKVSLLGELDKLELYKHYKTADLFVLATLQETYGMAIAEALAHGLPVVSTTTGAIPDLVSSDAGILVPPGDTMAFTKALTSVLSDPDLRKKFTSGARRVSKKLPSWDNAFKKMSTTLKKLKTHG
jgi:glycosyltransferase involved in cell wall biosynthesis